MLAIEGEHGTGYFEVQNPTPIRTAWRATGGNAWLAFTPMVGDAVNTNSAGVYLTTSADLRPGSYSSTITVTSISAGVDVSLPVGVTLDVLSNPVVTVDVTLPALIGVAMTFTTHAGGGSGVFQYKFWRFSAGTGWTMVRDYDPSPSWTWTPTASDTGDFVLQVWVRLAGSSADWEAWGVLPFTVSSTPRIRSVAANVAFPVAPGTPITWTVAADGGVAPLAFKFWRYKQGGGWTMVQDYSPSNAWTWTPGYDDPGTYVLQVWVRSAGSSASYEAYTASDVWTVVRTPVTVLSVTPSLSSPALTGTSITWTALASGGSGALEYQFWVFEYTDTHFARGSWTLAQPYGATNTFAWTPIDPGYYAVQVWVRSAGSGASFEGWAMTQPFAIQSIYPPITIQSLTSDVSLPRPVGTPITWTALATGGSGTLQYQFWVFKYTDDSLVTGTWTLAQPYSGANTFSWTPASAGIYKVQVWARSAGSGISHEASLDSLVYRIQ
jgi:hypothetical protein